MVNTSYNQAGSVITDEELAQRMENLREARRAKFKFIKIKLDESNFPTPGQTEVSVNGVKDVKMFPAGLGKDRRPTYTAVVRGGPLVFHYKRTNDPDTDGMFAYMLDDDEKGIYATKGYNRDFLASHYSTGWFIIEDPKVQKDVEARYRKMKAAVAVAEKERIKKKEISVNALLEKKKEIEKQLKLAESLSGRPHSIDDEGIGEKVGDNSTDSRVG